MTVNLTERRGIVRTVSPADTSTGVVSTAWKLKRNTHGYEARAINGPHRGKVVAARGSRQDILDAIKKEVMR